MFVSIKSNQRLDKQTWGACMALSALYFFLFYTTATNQEDPPFGQGLTDGFCVWDFPPPHEEGVECDNINSHRIAWWEDAIMTIIAMVLFAVRIEKDGWNKTTAILFIGIAAVIFFHGMLHRWMASMGCFLPIDGSSIIQDLGEFLYAAFTFMLCLVLFAFGVPDMEKKHLWAGAIAVVTLVITKNIVPQYSLSTLFAISHPLSSFVGYISTSGYLTWPVAVVFFLATAVGLVELVACASFQLAVGGHVWYDFFLHVSMLVALLIAPSPSQATRSSAG